VARFLIGMLIGMLCGMLIFSSLLEEEGEAESE
jgi:hypothetical protein